MNLSQFIQSMIYLKFTTTNINSKYNDANTSVLEDSSKVKKIVGNTVTLMIDDNYEYQSATIVLLDENERILDKKPTTVGG